MANIITPVQKPPGGRKLYWGREDVQVGVPPAGTTGHPIIVEPVSGLVAADQRDIYDATEFTGAMSDRIGQDELTHYIQNTLTSPFRVHGITGQGLMCLMGNQAYTPGGGAAPYTHSVAPAPLTNRTNTLSLWFQTTTDAANQSAFVKQMTRCTVTSWQATFGPGSALDISMDMWGSWPTYQSPPTMGSSSTILTGSTTSSIQVSNGAGSQFTTGQTVTVTGMTGTITVGVITPGAGAANDLIAISGGAGTPTIGGTITYSAAGTSMFYVGNDPVYTITRTMGWQGSFTMYGSTGTAYAPRVLSGTLTVSRPAEAVYAADSQTIVDVALGPVSITGTIMFQFDGYAPGTVGRDFSDFKPAGSNANPMSLKWTDADGHYVQIQSYYWKWHPFELDFTGQYVKGNGTFTAYNDPTLVMSATPQLSVVKNLTITNNIAAAMIGP